MFIHNKYYRAYTSIITKAMSRGIIEGYAEKHHILPRCMGGTDDVQNLVFLTAREHFVCHLLLIKCVTQEYTSKLAYAAWQQGRSIHLKNGKITSRMYAILRKKLSETYTGRKRPPFSDTVRKAMSESHKGRKYTPTDAQLSHLKKLHELNKTRIVTDETRQKLSDAGKNRKLSDEHKANIAKSKSGKKREKFSHEWIQNMSDSRTGEKNHMYGKKRSQETIDKIRETKRLNPNNSSRGPMSDETKQKLREIHQNKPDVKCPHCGKIGKGSNMTRYHLSNCKFRRLLDMDNPMSLQKL